MYDADIREAAVSRDPSTPLSARDWHVLVALSDEALHGYGIMKAVERDSGGRVSAEIGSLYRVLDRLMDEGLVEEVEAPADAPAETRGRPRRYYGLTPLGRGALREEAVRLRDALDLARARSLLPDARP
jgi:DNA-binding PadR family transcriptional regulator